MASKAMDTVGVGRYILNFLIFGLIGLGIQYLLRDKGWTATWVNLAAVVTITVIVLSA